MKQEDLLKQEKIKKAAPILYELLDYNYQTMCAINMVLDNEVLSRKMLKECMEKTFKVIRKIQD